MRAAATTQFVLRERKTAAFECGQYRTVQEVVCAQRAAPLRH